MPVCPLQTGIFFVLHSSGDASFAVYNAKKQKTKKSAV
jgi:hypothetical protein